MGTIMVLNLALGCHLVWGLVTHLAGSLVMMLFLGHLCGIFYVLTLWLQRYWYVVRWVALEVFHHCGQFAQLAPE